MKKSTKKLTVASMLCALSFVFMLIGSFIEVMDLSASALASFIIIFAVIELGGAYPALIWAVSSAIALIMLPNKLPAIYFAVFFGWYPIVKNIFERVPTALSWVLKILSFALSFVAAFYIGMFIVGTEEIAAELTPLLAIFGIAVFAVYDIALTRIISAYMKVWRKKLKFKL